MLSASLNNSRVRRGCAGRPRATRESTTGRRSTRTTATTRVCHATALTKADCSSGRSDYGRINTDCDPSEETLLDAVTEVDVVKNRVGGSSFLGEDAIIGVEQEFLSVGDVGLDGFGIGDELLVEEELANVGDVAASQGLVLLVDGGVDVSKDYQRVSPLSFFYRLVDAIGLHTVDVSSASSVVTREGGVELQNTVLVTELDTAEHGVIDVARVSSVAVAASDYTTVDTSTVAVPGLKSDLWDGFTGVSVNDLNIESQRHTRITLSDVLADILARDP